MKQLIVFIAGVLLYTSCENKQALKEEPASDSVSFTYTVKPNVPDLVPPQQFTVAADKSLTFTTAEGMKVLIPASAFTTKDGKTVKGNVTIRVKEYRNPADILFSGIDMVYHDKDGAVQMESDGMFDMTAWAGTEELVLKANKSIGIDLPVRSSKTGYKLFYMEPSSGKWVITQNNLLQKKPAMPAEQVTEEDVMTIEWAGSETLKRTVNGKTFFLMPLHDSPGERRYNAGIAQSGQELNGLDFLNVIFEKVRPDLTAFPELTIYKDVRWMIKDMSGIAMYQPFLKHDTIVSAVIEKRNELSNTFFINLQGTKYKRQVLMTATCLPESEDENREIYNAMLEERPVDEKKVQEMKTARQVHSQQAELFRAFYISKMGLYNCDRLYLMKSAHKVSVTFTSEDGKNYAKPSTIYVIDKNINSVWTYYFPEITVDLASESILFFVTDSGRLAYVSAANMDALKTKAGKQTLIYTEKASVSDPEAIRALIESETIQK